MKYYIFALVVLLLSACNNQEETQLPQIKGVVPKKEEAKKEVKVKLSPSISSKKQSESQGNKEEDWIRKDSLLILNFIESVLVKNQISFNNYLNFFGEQSEFEIEELISKFGDEAEEESQQMYSNAKNHNSLALKKIRTKIQERIGDYQSIKSLEFSRKNVDINYFILSLEGVYLTEKYSVLTNSSEGRSHYIVDVLSNKKSILNNQLYD